MVRTQISLTAEQRSALQQWAKAEGRSMSAIIRDALDELFGRPDVGVTREERRRRALAAGTFDSGCADVAERRDDNLASGGRR